jgi:hypothetical protein
LPASSVAVSTAQRTRQRTEQARGRADRRGRRSHSFYMRQAEQTVQTRQSRQAQHRAGRESTESADHALCVLASSASERNSTAQDARGLGRSFVNWADIPTRALAVYVPSVGTSRCPVWVYRPCADMGRAVDQGGPPSPNAPGIPVAPRRFPAPIARPNSPRSCKPFPVSQCIVSLSAPTIAPALVLPACILRGNSKESSTIVPFFGQGSENAGVVLPSLLTSARKHAKTRLFRPIMS